jgi:hypothetical protein
VNVKLEHLQYPWQKDIEPLEARIKTLEECIINMDKNFQKAMKQIAEHLEYRERELKRKVEEYLHHRMGAGPVQHAYPPQQQVDMRSIDELQRLERQAMLEKLKGGG